MSISLKVLEKAIVNKDRDFLVRHLIPKLVEYGWTSEDIVALADKLRAAAE